MEIELSLFWRDGTRGMDSRLAHGIFFGIGQPRRQSTARGTKVRLLLRTYFASALTINEWLFAIIRRTIIFSSCASLWWYLVTETTRKSGQKPPYERSAFFIQYT